MDPDDGPATPTTGDTPSTGSPTTTTMGATTTTGEADSTTDATESGGAPMCGNSIIEGDEQCDDGLKANQPGNRCTNECKAAACGDGVVQVSNDEVCDDGPLNTAQPGYGQCSTACQRGGYCGDGIVQPGGGEECEPSDDPDGLKNCASMCKHNSRFVFLSSASYTGNLGGIAGADKACNEFAAASPELTGTYRAWLLVDGQTLADRFPEFAEPAAWNFTNLGADLLAKSFQELVAVGPVSPVAYTELGAPLPNVRAWTNITAAGTVAGGDCGQWTSMDGVALVGHAGFLPDQGPMAQAWRENRWWTDYLGYKRACKDHHHIYCIQVAD